MIEQYFLMAVARATMLTGKEENSFQTVCTEHKVICLDKGTILFIYFDYSLCLKIFKILGVFYYFFNLRYTISKFKSKTASISIQIKKYQSFMSTKEVLRVRL